MDSSAETILYRCLRYKIKHELRDKTIQAQDDAQDRCLAEISSSWLQDLIGQLSITCAGDSS